MQHTWEQVETPAVIVDADILERNLREKADQAKQAGVKLRPHAKTHKSVWVAKKQLEYGASGITVAKLGEAEVMVDGGITDILVAYPIVGEQKLRRLAALMEKANIIVSTDNYEVAKGLSELGESIGKKVSLYIDVNTGLGRCGKEPGEETAELVKQIATLPGVHVQGLMTHSGHGYGKTNEDELRDVAIHEADSLVMTQKLLAEQGIIIDEISVGSTPASKYIGSTTGATEMRPGAYVYGDRSQTAIGLIGEDQCALSIIATVVSMPRPGLIIVDAGSKTFGTDLNRHVPGNGVMRGNDNVLIYQLSEEHANVRVPEDMEFKIGQKIEFIPNHCCFTVNLHDELTLVKNGEVIGAVQVDARGKIR